MRNKEYFYIANELSKSNKKKTKNTIFGVSFCSLLFIVIIYIALCFNNGIVTKLNAEPNIASIHLAYPNTNGVDINNSYKETIANNELIKEKVNYKTYLIKFDRENNNLGFNSEMQYPTIQIGNDQFKYRNDVNKIFSDHFFSYSLDNSKIITDEETNFLDKNGYGNPILSGSLFQDNINEILLSSNLLDYFGISDYDSVIGKSISYSLKPSNSKMVYYNGNEISKDYNDLDAYLFKDFIVVGVFNSNIYECPSRWSQKNENANFWIKESSIYKPNITINKYGYSYTYNIELSKAMDEAIKAKKIYFLDGFNYTMTNEYFETETHIYQFKDVKDAYKFSKSIETMTNENSFNLYWNLEAYFDLYPFYLFGTIILGIVGGTIALVTLINIYKILNYDLKNKTKFLSICKALGLKNKNLIKIYLTQITIILLKSLIYIIVFSFIICLSLNIGMNKTIGSTYYEGVIRFKFGFSEYPIILISVFIIQSLIIYLTSYLTCKKMNKIAVLSKLNS